MTAVGDREPFSGVGASDSFGLTKPVEKICATSYAGPKETFSLFGQRAAFALLQPSRKPDSGREMETLKSRQLFERTLLFPQRTQRL